MELLKSLYSAMNQQESDDESAEFLQQCKKCSEMGDDFYVQLSAEQRKKLLSLESAHDALCKLYGEESFEKGFNKGFKQSIRFILQCLQD